MGSLPGKPSVEKLFSTPVVIDHLPGAAAINAALEAVILARRAADAGIERSNIGGWHSDLDLLRWATDAVRPVVARAVELADANTIDLQARPGERRGWLLEAWANVSEAESGNAAHHHGGCYWSAVYYVRVGKGEGGELALQDPRMPLLDMHAPFLRFREAGGEQALQIRPSSGMLILFPSWLVHSVARWRGSQPRISVALNLTAPPLPR